MKDIIKCYVSGNHIPNGIKEGTVSFAVPEYGVLFRCGAEGAKAELEIIAFLTFLRFAEHNKDIFKSRTIHVYTDFPLLVYLMNKGVAAPDLAAVVNEAEKYAKELKFEVKWIDPKENRAAGSIADIPAMPVDSKIKIKTFANLDIARPHAESDKTPGKRSVGGIKI